jgi:DNA-cytosine methyltransferase
MLRHVDLCSGIGGFALGFEWAELSYPILFCDIEPWSRKVLKKHWPHVPICEDVKEIANEPDEFISGHIDILTAGYPCQPFSLAGKRRGEEDDRHIWPYIFSIIQKKRPSWTVFENVYGHITMGLDTVLTDLESEGYATRTFIIPACAVGAPHKRDRLWIISHTDRRVGDVSDSEYDGRIASEKPRGVKEAVRQESEGENYSLDFEGAGDLSRAESDVADTDNNGHKGRFREFETRNENVAGKNSQSVRSANTDNSFRQSNDGGDKKEARVDGVVSGSSDGGASVLAKTTGVRGVSQVTDNHKGVGSQDGYQKNYDRALVQEGQGRVQSSEYIGLGKDQATFENNQIRSGDDNNSEQGMGKQNFLADTHNEGVRSWERGSVSELVQKDDAGNNHQGGVGDYDGNKDGKPQIICENETIVDNANGKGLEGVNDDTKSSRGVQQKSGKRCKVVADSSGSEQQGGGKGSFYGERPVSRELRRSRENSQGGWAVEPSMGRVAHGVPGRVDRLRGLGNAIVPQISYKIGVCIKEMANEGS